MSEGKTNEELNPDVQKEKPKIVFGETQLPEHYDHAVDVCQKVREQSYKDLSAALKANNLPDVIKAGDGLRFTAQVRTVLGQVNKSQNPSQYSAQEFRENFLGSYEGLADKDAQDVRDMGKIISTMENKPDKLKTVILRRKRKDFPGYEDYWGGSKLLVEFPEGAEVIDPFGINDNLTQDRAALVYIDPLENACMEGRCQVLRDKFHIEGGIKKPNKDTEIALGYIPYHGIEQTRNDLAYGTNPGDADNVVEAYDEATGESRDAGVYMAAAACGLFSTDPVNGTRRIGIPRKLI